MNNKKKIISIILCIAIMLSIGTITAFATYGDTTTVSISSSRVFQKTSMFGTKSSSSSEWHLQVDGKTMWSKPTARLVNSKNVVRSETLTISKSSGTFVGVLHREAEIPHFYYLSVKPASSQIGTDTITGKVNPD